MKTYLNKGKRGGFSLLELLFVVAMIALLGCILAPRAKADSQGLPTTMGSITNLPISVAPSQASNSVSCWVPVRQGRGLALSMPFKLGASGTQNVTIYCSPSVDGTNVSATVWTFGASANGTTQVTATTNWARGTLDGYQYVVVTGVTNAGGSGYVTNLPSVYNFPNN